MNDTEESLREHRNKFSMWLSSYCIQKINYKEDEWICQMKLISHHDTFLYCTGRQNSDEWKRLVDYLDKFKDSVPEDDEYRHMALLMAGVVVLVDHKFDLACFYGAPDSYLVMQDYHHLSELEKMYPIKKVGYCNHSSFKHYEGFREAYDYCADCGRSVDEIRRKG